MRKFIISIMVLILLVVTLISTKYITKETDNNEDNGMAFYYEENIGSYVPSTKNKWDSGDYALNVQNSICNGEKNPNYLSWNNDTNQVILNSVNSTRCTLYFDKKRQYTLLSNYPIEGSERELTNILGKDGDFENIEPWNENNLYGHQNNVSCELSRDIKSHGKTSCKVQGTSENVETLLYSSKFYHTDINHYYYVKFNSYNDSDFNVSIEYWWPPSATNRGLYFLSSNYEHKNWKTFSYLGQNITAGTDDFKIRVDNNNSYRDLDLYFDELMMIDLTEGYGDNIPSKEELDNTLIYFDGTVDMKSVMGLQGEFKVTGVSDNQEIECNNDGQARVSNGVVTITGNSPYITCYLKKV